MDVLGKSPVPVPILALGKLAMFICWLFFFAGSLDVPMLYDAIWNRVTGFMMAIGGLAMVILGLRDCGESVSVGLSREETELRIRGIFRFTRNPMYLGGFVVSAGSCCYSIHPVNFILFLTTVTIHHVIVLKEEEFLQTRFGTQWREYASHVPRYFGARK